MSRRMWLSDRNITKTLCHVWLPVHQFESQASLYQLCSEEIRNGTHDRANQVLGSRSIGPTSGSADMLSPKL